jgi:hypothetical protein
MFAGKSTARMCGKDLEERKNANQEQILRHLRVESYSREAECDILGCE